MATIPWVKAGVSQAKKWLAEAHVEGQVQKKTKALVAALAAGLAGRRARVSHCPK